MVTEVSLNLFALKHRLEGLQQRDISIAEIARETRLSQDGLYKAFNGNYGGVQFDTLGKLLDYFNSNGLNIELGDMFVVRKVEERSAPGKLAPAEVAVGALG